MFAEIKASNTDHLISVVASFEGKASFVVKVDDSFPLDPRHLQILNCKYVKKCNCHVLLISHYHFDVKLARPFLVAKYTCPI